jgi:hypothetical protein
MTFAMRSVYPGIPSLRWGKKWGKVPTEVLFVCVHNAGRSQMAALPP